MCGTIEFRKGRIMTEEEKLITALKAAGLEQNINIHCYPPLDKCFMRGAVYTFGGIFAFGLFVELVKLMEWIL